MPKPAKPASRAVAPSRIRCAIYTRKSTEEGLDQAFNSLDAQREACAAYVLSQRHEGWALVPDHYDDGGFSGGNMDRPGLKQLMADVAAGKVDVIVVYKVDRLTRALSDFARIVDVLDGAGASFVSITQAFNTTTSMGRLTLNVLLSFAQFEREVTGERIRDKVAASKRKGMWMGGSVPLGYLCMDWRHIRHLLLAGEAAYDELINLCVWSKANAGMGSLYRSAHELVAVFKKGRVPHRNNVKLGASGRYRTNVWEYAGMSTPSKERTEALALHPTVKPLALVRDAILDVTLRGDIVLDPFGGSGTTLLAAARIDRVARLIELDPHYCDVILRRASKTLKIEPMLAATGEFLSTVTARRTEEAAHV